MHNNINDTIRQIKQQYSDIFNLEVKNEIKKHYNTYPSNEIQRTVKYLFNLRKNAYKNKEATNYVINSLIANILIKLNELHTNENIDDQEFAALIKEIHTDLNQLIDQTIDNQSNKILNNFDKIQLKELADEVIKSETLNHEFIPTRKKLAHAHVKFAAIFFPTMAIIAVAATIATPAIIPVVITGAIMAAVCFGMLMQNDHKLNKENSYASMMYNKVNSICSCFTTTKIYKRVDSSSQP